MERGPGTALATGRAGFCPRNRCPQAPTEFHKATICSLLPFHPPLTAPGRRHLVTRSPTHQGPPASTRHRTPPACTGQTSDKALPVRMPV